MNRRKKLPVGIVLATAAIIAFVWTVNAGQHAKAALLSNRAISMSTSIANEAGVEYTLTFGGQSAGTVGSIRLQLCSNDPFIGQPCTPPPGMDVSQASIISETGMTGFSIHPSTTWNELILTRTPGPAASEPVVIRLGNITNPSLVGTIFGRLETFASNDASGANHDAGGLAIATLPEPVSVRTEVPPYLSFCLGITIEPYDCGTAVGSYIDFGEFSPSQTATGQTKLLVSTNAEFGYSLRAFGPTLTSGINVIPALSDNDISRVGTSQFGLNLRANTVPPAGEDVFGGGTGLPSLGYDTPNVYRFVSGEVLAGHSGTEGYRMYTVTYIVNVAPNQAPGIYVTTLTYVALASF